MFKTNPCATTIADGILYEVPHGSAQTIRPAAVDALWAFLVGNGKAQIRHVVAYAADQRAVMATA